MVNIYVKWITEGRMSIDDVPPKWKEEVKKVLGVN